MERSTASTQWNWTLGFGNPWEEWAALILYCMSLEEEGSGGLFFQIDSVWQLRCGIHIYKWLIQLADHPITLYINCTSSFVPRSSHHPIFDRLKYAKQEGEPSIFAVQSPFLHTPFTYLCLLPHAMLFHVMFDHAIFGLNDKDVYISMPTTTPHARLITDM